mgnify:CR=1 FL=1
MISFIIPFVTVEEDKFLNLNDGFDITDSSAIVYSTIKTIKNINSLKCEKEIILVDNSHTWPNLDLPNLKVIKGWQAVPLEELRHVPEFMNHFEIQDECLNFLRSKFNKTRLLVSNLTEQDISRNLLNFLTALISSIEATSN